MTRVLLAVALVVAAACSGGDGDDGDVRSAPTTVATTTAAPDAERYREPIFEEFEVTSDVVYGSAPGLDGAPEELTIDVYEPVGDDAVDRAAIIFVHGGGFGFGDKTDGVSPRLAEHFVTLGYVTLSANYRLLAPGGCTGASAAESSCSTAALEGIHDGQAAVRWLRANASTYGVDPDRIGIGGESAGGVIAYGAGAWSDAPGESGTPGVSSEVQAYMSLSGGLPSALFADEGDAPGILFAATGDRIVPYQWSADIAARLAALDVPVELVTYDSDVHVPFLDYEDDIIQRTTDFFLTHLVGGTP